MKTVYVRLFTLVFALAALACGARAQAVDQISITMDHDFVVLGKTLPAGTYKVFRASGNETRGLIFSSVKNHAGAIVLATDSEANSSGETLAKFEVLGDQYVLTQLETLEHVFTIPVAKTFEAQIAARQQSGTLTSVSVGSK
jgi:hypothetical protein